LSEINRLAVVGPGFAAANRLSTAWIKSFRLKGVGVMIVRLIIGVVVGGLVGYGMYRFIGCSTGACPITANPWTSILFGMIFGAMLSRAF
jgi:hypothetical protein